MKALIMAGGLGTRLRPITNTIPKCMIQVGNKPIIEYQIESLLKHGVSEIIIITGYMSEVITKHLKSKPYFDKLLFIKNENFQNSRPAEGLWCARNSLNGDVIYLNGDVVLNSDLIDQIVHTQIKCCTIIKDSLWDEEQVKVKYDSNNRLTEIGKYLPEEEGMGEFIGITKFDEVFNKKMVQRLEKIRNNSVPLNLFAVDIINAVINEDAGEMHVIKISNKNVQEIDTPEDLNRTKYAILYERAISKIATLFQIIYSYVIRFLAYLIPKKKGLVVFYGWHKNEGRDIFADNSKYLFLYLNKIADFQCVWLSESEILRNILDKKGLKSKKQGSFSAFYYAIRAEFTVIDGIPNLYSWRNSSSSKIVQLWHGKGLKRSGFDSEFGLRKYNKILNPYIYQKYFKVICTSHLTQKMMQETFRAEMKDIEITGLPRNEILFSVFTNSEIDSSLQLKKITDNKDKYSKIILYAPTFRRQSKQVFDNLNFEHINKSIAEKNILLVVSPHPKIYRVFEKKDYSNIKFIDSGWDIYPYLNKVDCLITDYSSSFVDFLLTEKPIIFFVPDIDEYSKNPGLHNNYLDLMPGPIAKNQAELIDSIVDYKYENWKENILRVKKLFHEPSANFCKDIIAKIFTK